MTVQTFLHSPNGTAEIKSAICREDYLLKPDYFMGIACLAAQRSKDPETQVGAVVIAPDDRILSIGYNGMPIGCDDVDMNWGPNKNFFVCHAEMNAIVLAGKSVSGGATGCTLYVTLFPCNECAKVIVQAGIKKVVYLRQKPKYERDDEEIKRFLRHLRIDVQKASLTRTSIQINLEE